MRYFPPTASNAPFFCLWLLLLLFLLLPLYILLLLLLLLAPSPTAPPSFAAASFSTPTLSPVSPSAPSFHALLLFYLTTSSISPPLPFVFFSTFPCSVSPATAPPVTLSLLLLFLFFFSPAASSIPSPLAPMYPFPSPLHSTTSLLAGSPPTASFHVIPINHYNHIASTLPVEQCLTY